MITQADLTGFVKLFNESKMKGVDEYQLNILAEKILELVIDNYSNNIEMFVSKHTEMSPFELNKWMKINHIQSSKKGVRLLDCACGNGRDLVYAQQIGYDAYGCELNKDLLNRIIKVGEIHPSKLLNADIRNLPFQSEMFDVVRHNASFLHMPIIGPGYTIDKTIEESNRVLKKGGILYIFTKFGEGYVSLDTGDGLGERPFQLFTENTLCKIISYYGFEVCEVNRYDRRRNNKNIEWIEMMARKLI